MFDEETRAFLASGCSIILGTVSADGAPHAGRGWGLDVVEDGEVSRVRLLLDADDEVTIAQAAAGGSIAITAADVHTLRTLQLKGIVLGVEAASAEDVERGERHVEAFSVQVELTDQRPRWLAERLAPIGYVPCVAEIREVFDQTPGPGAGAPVAPSPR